MLRRAVIAAAVPFVLKALRDLINIMDLVDRHALVGEMQYLVVHIRVEVTLRPQHLLDAGVAPARPVMRRKHHLGLQAEAIGVFWKTIRTPSTSNSST